MTDSRIYVVDGAAEILIGTGALGVLESFGFTANGAQIIEDVFMGDIPTDENGGDLGPPGDIQYFGQVDRVRLEMTRWDPAIADKIEPRMNGTFPGIISTPGTLVAGGGFGYRLVIKPLLRPRNYFLAVPRQPIERNKGTRYSRLACEFDCYAVGGILYNLVTS